MLLRIVVDTTADHLLIRAAGELDMASSPILQRPVEDSLADGHRVVLLDLSGIDFLDSSGLGALIALHRTAAAHGGRVAVVAASTAVRRVVDLTGVRHVLHLHDTVADALQGR